MKDTIATILIGLVLCAPAFAARPVPPQVLQHRKTLLVRRLYNNPKVTGISINPAGGFIISADCPAQNIPRHFFHTPVTVQCNAAPAK
jgi:hypothetical protein